MSHTFSSAPTHLHYSAHDKSTNETSTMFDSVTNKMKQVVHIFSEEPCNTLCQL